MRNRKKLIRKAGIIQKATSSCLRIIVGIFIGSALLAGLIVLYGYFPLATTVVVIALVLIAMIFGLRFIKGNRSKDHINLFEDISKKNQKK